MNIHANVIDGKVVLQYSTTLLELQKNEGKHYIFTVEEENRSVKQNNALHLYCGTLASELNDRGLDMRVILSEKADLHWTLYSVKEYIWKPVQRWLFGKKSTKQLSKAEVSQVYDVVNRTISERTQGEVSLPFPSIETIDKI